MEKQKQDQPHQFIYPVSFEDFVNYRRKQSQAALSGFSIKQLSKLRKLKKLLETTQQKICNRIKLFKKVSMGLQKKKEKQNHWQERIQNIKKNTRALQQSRHHQAESNYMKSTKSSACGLRIRQTNEGLKKQSQTKKSEVILQQKYDNAKQIKMWKQRNKIIVQQRKLKQMRQKVQSANLIRSNRNRAKQIRIQCQHEKMEEARRIKEEKFKQEIEKYDELQCNLTKLQREEREALIMWKRAMESS